MERHLRPKINKQTNKMLLINQQYQMVQVKENNFFAHREHQRTQHLSSRNLKDRS